MLMLWIALFSLFLLMTFIAGIAGIIYAPRIQRWSESMGTPRYHRLLRRIFGDVYGRALEENSYALAPSKKVQILWLRIGGVATMSIVLFMAAVILWSVLRS